MTDFKLILSQVNQTLSSLPDWNNLENIVSKFHDIWLKLGKRVQQELVPAKINEKETKYQSPRTLREKRYYTPLGEMVVKRRAYVTSDGLKVKVDEELGLPKDKWLSISNSNICSTTSTTYIGSRSRRFTGRRQQTSGLIFSLIRSLLS